jgi:pyridoxal phosphate enzyme (YggS family)
LPLEEEDSFRSRLDLVENRIARALERSGRKRSDISLVAVTKKFPAHRIREAYEAGLVEFGENYVQEFAGKRAELEEFSEARFHLIGHLQSNKAKQAAELFQVIEAVDSSKLLRRLNAIAGELRTAVEVLFEIKLSDEENKTGASPDELPMLVEAAEDCPHLMISGLMVVPPWSENPEDSRPYFRTIATLAKQYGFSTISMGMSGDFEVAIEEGSTTIRVGTALFGPRPKL